MKRALILAQLILAACVLLIAAGPQNKYVVLIDAGHGGQDPGVVAGSVDEKGLTLDLAQRLGSALESEGGIAVRYTREADASLGLKERMDLADKDVDLIISLHADQSDNPKASGMRLYAQADGLHSQESGRIGEIFRKTLEDMGVPFSASSTANFYVLKHAPCPAVLFSVGYLSNESDREFLYSDTYREALAEKLAVAVKNSSAN